MQTGQILTYGVEGRLAEQLRELAQTHGLWFRALRKSKACIHLLRQSGPAVVVVKVGRDLEREMTLVEQIGRLFPDTEIIVVGDNDNPSLAGLAWDLGVRAALFPLPSFALLAELIVSLLPGKSQRKTEERP